jgi:hypothetical protein
MNPNTDTILSRILKNWVSQHQPPTYGRARLLAIVAITPRKKYNFSALIPRTEFNDCPIRGSNTNEWAPAMFTWFFEKSFTTCMQARV